VTEKKIEAVLTRSICDKVHIDEDAVYAPLVVLDFRKIDVGPIDTLKSTPVALN